MWRDVKVHGDHALVVPDASGAHGMQVFDLTRLRAVTDPPATFEPDALYDGVHSAHNVVVNPESDVAVVVSASGGGETCGQGLHMVDIADPLEPRFAGCFTHSAGGSPMAGMTHDAQCVVYAGPDGEHEGREICLNSNFTGLVIADVTDPAAPSTVAVGQYPGSALPHQGWLTEDHRYFLMGDEGDEIQGLVPNTRTLVWDLSDLDDPVVHAEYFHPTRAIDHNLYVRGSLAYQANYDAGLRILDISDVEHIEEAGFFDTVPFGSGEPSFRLGAWSVYPYFESGTIVVTSGAEGLFLLRYAPEQPVS